VRSMTPQQIPSACKRCIVCTQSEDLPICRELRT
jgi:hypothetical protein